MPSGTVTIIGFGHPLAIATLTPTPDTTPFPGPADCLCYEVRVDGEEVTIIAMQHLVCKDNAA